MEDSRIKKIGTIIMLAIIFIMLIMIIVNTTAKILYKIGLNNSIICFLAQKDEIQKSVKVNWKEKYPFQEGQTNINEESTINKKDIVEKIYQKLKKVEEEIENQTSDEIIGYEKFLELSYIYDKAIMYSLNSNNSDSTRVKIGDHCCVMDSATDVSQEQESLKNFARYINGKNINFLYIQVPNKIERNNTEIMPIYNDYSNNNADNFINGIKGEVDYIDLRQNIKYTGTDYLKLFFKTDHHWKPETGIWATGEIIDYLNANYNYNINKEMISNINNYNIDVHKDLYFGSDGRYVTLANSKPEDISIITPKFDTNLTVEIPDKGLYKQGTLSETLIDYSKLNYRDIYKSNCYSTYGYGNKAIVKIHNNNIKDGKKLLIIKDSFTNVVYPYLSLGIEDCCIVDLRYFDGSIKTYISEYNPDTVIVMYYTKILNENDNMWIFK